MNSEARQALYSYLLWQAERGQVWLDLHSETSSQELSKPISQPLIPQLPKSECPTPELGLFMEAGKAGAELLAVIDCISGKGIVEGEERLLLLSILEELGIDPRRSFYLLGLRTDSYLRPLASPEEYCQQYQAIIEQVKPLKILFLGGLVSMLLKSAATEGIFVPHPRDMIREGQAFHAKAVTKLRQQLQSVLA